MMWADFDGQPPHKTIQNGQICVGALFTNIAQPRKQGIPLLMNSLHTLYQQLGQRYHNDKA